MTPPAHLRFRASYRVLPVEPQHLFLLDEHRQVILRGEAYVRLAGLLDGTRTVADLTEILTREFPLHTVLGALNHLQTRQYVVDGAGAGIDEPGLRAFTEYPPHEGPAGWSRLSDAVVHVRRVGNLPPIDVEAAFRACGLTVDREGTVLVVVADDYLQPELERINQEALETGRPWMLLKPQGLIPWIGPVLEPGRTGCWACLAQRLRANRRMEQFILDRRAARKGPGDESRGPLVTSRGYLPATLHLAVSLAATELGKWLLGPPPTAPHTDLVTFDLQSRVTRRHTLVRRPQCPVCGTGSGAAPGPRLHLQSRPKRFKADGGHRAVNPSDTYDRLKHHVSPILGAVTDLRPTLGSNNELTHSYVAGHNFAMGVESVVFLRQTLRGMSGGKGSTEIQAKVSGLCEAIERYCGVYWGDEPSRRDSHDALGDDAVHPNDCMGFSHRQYASRVEWNRTQPASRCLLVPEPFDTSTPVDWTPAWSLTRDAVRYLPTNFCYYGHPDFSGGWCNPDSNGSAAGNTVEEAILQGFMELVERDCVGIWWYNQIQRRGVDLASFGLPYLDEIVPYYHTLDRELWVLDITSDLDIATFACVSRRTSGPTEDVLLGFGAHFDPRVAILRAVTEVNQFLPSVSIRNREGVTYYMFGDELARHWWTTARVPDLAYLRPHPDLPPARCQDFEDPSTPDLAADVQLCVERVRQQGLEMIVLDQSRPDIDLAVVKVVVPGLCHFWRRLGTDRLSEVPVRQGWLPAPLDEAAFNPHTVFF